MTTLHDRLTDLAREVGDGLPEPDLWDRGQRLVRRRRGTQVIAGATAVCVLVLAFAAWQSTSRADLPVASETHGMRLPDEFVTPPKWLPGTEEAGPIGPLVAVLGARRGTWAGSDMALAGVSASTGEYRFLDLPDYGDGSYLVEPALSPDGRYLAYWTHTEVTYEMPVADGLAVYDTSTGEVLVRTIDSALGISPEELVWASDTEVRARWLTYSKLDDSGSSASEPAARRWDVVDDEWAKTAGVWPQMSESGRILATSRDQDEHYRLSRRIKTPVLGPGGRLAAVALTNGLAGYEPDAPRDAVLVGTLASDRRVELTPVPGVKADEAVAWRDEETVVVLRVGDDPSDQGTYEAVEVTTGEATPLTRVTAERTAPLMTIAADAWQAPTYDAPEPPSPWDPRVATGAGIGTVLAGFAVVLVWRRRVRA